MSESPDPIAEMLSIDDEQERNRAPEAELNVEAPPDKEPQERDESGKFKGKEEKAEPKEPEAKPDVKAEEPKRAEPKTDDTIPLPKYLREKGEWKETLRAYEERIKALEEKTKPAPPAPAPEPDFVEDPKGYVDHKLKGALEQVKAASEKAEETGKKAQELEAQTREAQEVQRFLGELQADEARFVQSQPDYMDALTHLRNIRAQQLLQLDPEVTQAQIIQTIRNEELNLAYQLKRAGRDPMQTAYNLAKTFGYQPKAKEEPKVEAKLPDVPNKRLPPDQTLGAGAGHGEDAPVYREDEVDPFDVAFASVKKMRA